MENIEVARKLMHRTKMKRIKATQNNQRGFTLTELLISVAIVGILSSIALPIYTQQITKTKQSDAAAILSNIQTSIASYVDEYSSYPSSWGDLAKISVIMTNKGPVEDNDTTLLSTSKTMQNEAYGITIKVDSSNKDHFILSATPTKSSNYNVKACIDVSNGASDIKLGMRGAITLATDTDLQCYIP